jgi:hypothetical protein
MWIIYLLQLIVLIGVGIAMLAGLVFLLISAIK